jgi:hypothetical protein
MDQMLEHRLPVIEGLALWHRDNAVRQTSSTSTQNGSGNFSGGLAIDRRRRRVKIWRPHFAQTTGIETCPSFSS